MSKINDGGPAYPVDSPSGCVYSGMSLRDWFAGQALAGLCAGGHYSPDNDWGDRSVAEHAGGIADAMLTEREKEGGE